MGRVGLGQVLLWTDLVWESYYFGQSESGTVIIVYRVRLGRYYCGQNGSGTGDIVDRMRVG